MPAGPSSSDGPSTTVTVKRKADGDEPALTSLLSESTRSLIASKVAAVPTVKKRKVEGKSALGIKMKGKAAAKAVV